jgi:hypothetical protein
MVDLREATKNLICALKMLRCTGHMYFNDCFFNSCQSRSDSCSIYNKTGQTLRDNRSKECHHHSKEYHL